MILQSILLFHTSSDYTSYWKIYFTPIQNIQVLTNLTLHVLYMYIYMEAQFQTFQQKMIKYTDT